MKLLMVLLVISTSVFARFETDINGFTVLDGPRSFAYHSREVFCLAYEDIHHQLYLQLVRESQSRRQSRELRRQTRVLNQRGPRLNRLLQRFMSSHQEQFEQISNEADSTVKNRLNRFLQRSLNEYMEENGASQTRFQEGTTSYQTGRPVCPAGYRLDADGVNCNGRGGGSTPYTNVVDFNILHSRSTGEAYIEANNCMTRYEGMNEEDAYYNAEIKKTCQNFFVGASDQLGLPEFSRSTADQAISQAIDDQVRAYRGSRVYSAADDRINIAGRWTWLLSGRRIMGQNPGITAIEFYEQLGNPEYLRTCNQSILTEERYNTESHSRGVRTRTRRSSRSRSI